MKARFLGHASVLLEAADGTTLLFDPYESGGFGGRMAYAPIAHRADVVVCTHGHRDHSAVDALLTAPGVVADEGRYGPYTIRRHPAWHDEYGGRRRGGAVDLVRVEADGLVLVHLSDVGHGPRACCVEALGPVDVLFVPVGGFYTVGAAQAHQWCRRLGARLVVPIHYRTARCTLPIRPLEPFLAHFDAVHRPGGATIEFTRALLRLEQQVVVLDHEM